MEVIWKTTEVVCQGVVSFGRRVLFCARALTRSGERM